MKNSNVTIGNRARDSKGTGLEVNSDKTKYMVMSPDHNTGRSHNIKNGNIFFEMVEEFK
jgi:hypothetical protein